MLPKTKSVKSFLFYALLVLLPFNIRHIFNYDQVSTIEGFREHLSWSISTFEIVLLALIMIYVFEFLYNLLYKRLYNKNGWMPVYTRMTSRNLLVIFFVAVLLLSFFFSFSQDKMISLQATVKILAFFYLFWIAKDFLRSKSAKRISIIILFLGGILQSLIALVQFVTQKSVSLKLLGESIIASDVLGVAKFEFAGEKFIRAYGTFPHPNILGVFLLFAFACGAWLFLKKRNGQNVFGNVALITGNALILVGIFLSYSRSVLLAFAILLITLLIAHRKSVIETYQKYCKKLNVHYLAQGAVGLIILFGLLFSIYNLLVPRLCFDNCPGDNSIPLRLTYSKAAMATIAENPVFGVGPGNFVENLKNDFSFELRPWEYQPVHNIYLLIASETGLLGLTVFLSMLGTFIYAYMKVPAKDDSFLQQVSATLGNPFVLAFLLFLLLGFVDHYFWTIPQSQALFWLSLAFFVMSSRIEKVTH